jgi:tetratricopeptide (TPR) repeat protein
MLIRAASYTEAIQLFKELVAEGYNRAELYNVVSEAYLKTGQLQQAYDVLRTATKIEPQAEDNYVDLVKFAWNTKTILGKEIQDVGIHYIPTSLNTAGRHLVMRGCGYREVGLSEQQSPPEKSPLLRAGLGGCKDKPKSSEGASEKSKQRIDFLVPYILAVALIHSGTEPGTPAADEAVKA